MTNETKIDIVATHLAQQDTIEEQAKRIEILEALLSESENQRRQRRQRHARFLQSTLRRRRLYHARIHYYRQEVKRLRDVIDNLARYPHEKAQPVSFFELPQSSRYLPRPAITRVEHEPNRELPTLAAIFLAGFLFALLLVALGH